jgi:hypothetical protein
MKKKFDDWVSGWSDGTLLLYFTALSAIQMILIISVLE